MIQFKRGGTLNWRALNSKLADGQPGYDKNKHKIKIGDGESSWIELPYASGLHAEDILCAENKAKVRYALDPEDATLITYGPEDPDDKTVGQLYLQYYDAEPEVDYIVNWGTDGIWTYRKWASGLAECWGTLTVTAMISSAFEGETFYRDEQAMSKVSYPFTFTKVPHEQASLQSPEGLIWLAGRGKNSKSETALYSFISPNKVDSADYNIILNVKGFWR